MDVIIEQSVKMCFADIRIQRIVRRILENAENYKKYDGNVESLEWQSLKLIMTEKMIGDDKIHVMRSLLLGEQLDIWDFMCSEEDPHSKFPIARTDPNVMLEVFKQNYQNRNCVNLRMTKVALEIEMAFPLYQQGEERIMAEIPNRDGVEYDPLWVAKFAKMFMQKRVVQVTMGMLAERHHTYLEMMDDYITPLVEQINYSIPSDGWKTAVENGNRSIYMRLAESFNRWKYCCANFHLVGPYCPSYEQHYYDFTNDE